MGKIKSIYDKLVIIIAKWLCENIDKVLHAIVSMIITILLCIFLPLWFSALLTLILGVAKECIDKYYGERYDWLDIVADIVGICIAVLFCLF